MNAIRQKVVVPANGVVEIRAPELTPGSEAEVIVLLDDEDDGEMEGLVRRYDEAKAEIAASGEQAVSWEQLKAELANEQL